jgi:hypothetical protein
MMAVRTLPKRVSDADLLSEVIGFTAQRLTEPDCSAELHVGHPLPRSAAQRLQRALQPQIPSSWKSRRIECGPATLPYGHPSMLLRPIIANWWRIVIARVITF